MMRAGWLPVLAALLGLMAGPGAAPCAPVPGAKSALAQVPASAPMVVHLRGVEEVKNRLVALVGNGVPEFSLPLAFGLNGVFQNGADGRKLRGLVKDGPIFLGLLELTKPPDEPRPFVIFAVNQYGEFRDNLLKENERKALKQDPAGFETTTLESGQEVYLIDRKDFAVATLSKESATLLAKKGQPGLDTKISDGLAAKLMEADLGVYVNMAEVNKAYGEQVKEGLEALKGVLKAVGDAGGPQEKAQAQMALRMFDGSFQVLEDSTSALFSLDLRPDSMVWHAEAELRAGSPTSTKLQGSELSAFKGLARLPAGQAFYTAQTPQLLKLLGAAALTAGVDPDSKEGKKLKRAVELLLEAGPGERLDAISLPLAGVQVCPFKDAIQAVEAEKRILEAIEIGSTFQAAPLKAKPVLKSNARKFQAFDLNEVQLEWDLDKLVNTPGLNDDMKKAMKEGFVKMLGDKTTLWFGTDGKSFLQVIARDWDSANALLESYYKGEGVGEEMNFKALRKELPAESTMLGIFDPVKYGTAVADLVKPTLADKLPIPIPANFPAARKGKPSYVGVSVSLQAHRVSTDMIITSQAIQDCFRCFVMPFFNQK